MSEGKKYDSGKPRMDLIPARMEAEVARVLAFGAEKYGAENWRQLDNMRSRYIAAAKRHINEIQQGNVLDAESGLLHAAHAVCCLMFLGEDQLLPANVEWPETEARMDVIGQNGNDGLAYTADGPKYPIVTDEERAAIAEQFAEPPPVKLKPKKRKSA